MPCFKGIAVSIHWNGSPLPEHGIQRQSRFSRISSYIPVPQPDLLPDSNKPEPARFAVSITLLTPGLPVPYSTPKPSESNPFPKPLLVGSTDASPVHRSPLNNSTVSPYIPMTNSDYETIAAYIYFDGRSKEEVATLLRPGEETWVNSRWVQIPASEGGGLAEREFLFREVGLERWLNGLDIQGDIAAERLERRRQKLERRRRKNTLTNQDSNLDDLNAPTRIDTIRYGDEGGPLDPVDDDYSGSSSDDDEPPAATGQIKVTMFRVLASGEIKKGEYSPQFDSHEDDEEPATVAERENGTLDVDVEHTTSFAKPKTLDPKSISTQTVTGIDGPEKPYASFTFFYRSERQLQKIGVLTSSRQNAATPASVKRRSTQLDFSKLGPLKVAGTVGFSAFRDQDSEVSRRRKSRKKDMPELEMTAIDDSEDDEDERGKQNLTQMQEVNETDVAGKPGPEEATCQGELAEGVGRIKLKRAHSTEHDMSVPNSLQDLTITEDASDRPDGGPSGQVGQSVPIPASRDENRNLQDVANVGSPMKKPRPFFDAPEKNTFTLGALLAVASGQIDDRTQSNVLPPSAALSSFEVEGDEQEL